jgi:tetratricopeptide (TPR) repeat protein
MIVKNESTIITRLLDSIINIIDSYCICDTGSTDNTIQILSSYFQKHNIDGKIVCEPFINFEHNRNFALNSCKNMDNADFIILLDADMVLKVNPSLDIVNFKNNLLKYDAHYLFQGSDNHQYKNTRIVKNNIDVSYWGVTHEYVQLPNNSIHGTVNPNEIFITDIGDGGSKQNKFMRDISLLENGLIQHPNNDRYTFYLANSYRDSGQTDKAIDTYKKRIHLGGWFEEIWQSYYQIGLCYEIKGQLEFSIFYWLKAYEIFPSRIENLYKIINYYRINESYLLAYEFFCIADNSRKNIENLDFLFTDTNVYAYLLDYELSIIGYYFNTRNYNMIKCCSNLFACSLIDSWMHDNVFSNYKFYAPTLHGELIDIHSDFSQLYPNFTSSTPSIVIHNNQLVINYRLVNYHIDLNGNYINQHKISTINIISYRDLDNFNHIVKHFELDYNTEFDGVYVGLEDIRLFSHKNNLLFNSNRGYQDKFFIEHGSIEINNSKLSTRSNLLKTDSQQDCEKNWILFQDKSGELKCIYSWHPLVIGHIDHNHTFHKTFIKDTNNFFKGFRGSTNGVLINNEIWFIAHKVSYEDRRFYYHSFIVMDPHTYAIKKYSPLFTFSKESVEYTLGFVHHNDSLIIGFSKLDKETHFLKVPLDNVTKLFNIIGFNT